MKARNLASAIVVLTLATGVGATSATAAAYVRVHSPAPPRLMLTTRAGFGLTGSPGTAMPSFHRTDDLARLDPQYQGKPVLSEAQLDDVVAYLSSLR